MLFRIGFKDLRCLTVETFHDNNAADILVLWLSFLCPLEVKRDFFKTSWVRLIFLGIFSIGSRKNRSGGIGVLDSLLKRCHFTLLACNEPIGWRLTISTLFYKENFHWAMGLSGICQLDGSLELVAGGGRTKPAQWPKNAVTPKI